MKRLILLTLLTLIGWIGATNTLRAKQYGKLFWIYISQMKTATISSKPLTTSHIRRT